MQICASCLWRREQDRRATCSFVLVFGHSNVDRALEQYAHTEQPVIPGYSAYCVTCRGVYLLQTPELQARRGTCAGHVDNFVHSHVLCEQNIRLTEALRNGTLRIV
jgi:hypothetical protein